MFFTQSKPHNVKHCEVYFFKFVKNQAMGFKKTTEQNSNYLNLEKKSIAELIQGIHNEDQNAVKAVALVLPLPVYALFWPTAGPLLLLEYYLILLAQDSV